MSLHRAPLPRLVRRSLDGWLRVRASSVKGPLIYAVSLGALAGVLVVPEAWLLARIVQRVVFEHHGLRAVLHLIELLVAVGLRAVLVYLFPLATTAMSTQVKAEIRRALREKLEALGPRFLTDAKTGDIASLLVEGVDTLDRYYVEYLPQMALTGFIPLAILAFVVPADWISGLVLLVVAPLIPIFMIIIGKGAEQLNLAQWRKLALMSTHFFDVIEGLSTLKIFGASRYEGKVIAEISEDYRGSTLKVLRVAFLSSIVLEFFATLGIALIAVVVGFRLYYGQMNFLPGFFVLLLAPEFFRPLRSMGAHYHARMEAIAASERIVALLNEQVLVPEDYAVKSSCQAIRLIRFEDVQFAYRSDDPALLSVNLTLEVGERVALVGRSGSGKSTVARLLLGLMNPDGGRVTVDGRDLRHIDPEEWRSRVTWLPQRPTLFAGTVAENIRLGVPGASDFEVMRAVRAAAAEDIIDRLPKGLDTVLGERGQGLSGGEIRRVALARALLKPAELLVLDEVEASLDRTTVIRLRERLKELPRDKIVLFVAHGPEAVSAADRTLLLHEGRVSDGPAGPAGSAAESVLDRHRELTP